MKILTFSIALIAFATPVLAADVRVAYLVDSKELRKGTIATTPLTFDVFDDATCVAPVASAVLDAGDVDLIEKVKSLRLKGGPKAPPVARIEHVLSGVSAEGALYVRVSGDGVVSVGPACQAQGPSGPAGAEGPPGASADFGSCVIRSSGFDPLGQNVKVACLAGETATGGGCRVAGSGGLQEGRPRDDGTQGWLCDTSNVGAETYAVCCQ